MAFIDIPTSSGGLVHLSAGTVYRITRGKEGASSADPTRIDFGSIRRAPPSSSRFPIIRQAVQQTHQWVQQLVAAVG